MKFRQEYKLNWTYHKPNSRFCYTECKYFDTELERNRYALNLFTQQKQGEIVLDWVEKNDLQIWER